MVDKGEGDLATAASLARKELRERRSFFILNIIMAIPAKGVPRKAIGHFCFATVDVIEFFCILFQDFSGVTHLAADTPEDIIYRAFLEVLAFYGIRAQLRG